MGKTVKGIYRQNPNGDFGFVDVEGPSGKTGYYVFFRNKGDALDGDEVEAEVRVFKGKNEASVKKVLKRADRVLVGELQLGNKAGFGFVVLKNDSFKTDVFVPGKLIGKARDGDIVGVKITKWAGKNPEGKIVEILGKKEDMGLELDTFILESGFKKEFPRNVEKVENFIKVEHELSKNKSRKDLRRLFTVTIDGEDAKDLDDAISVQKMDNGEYKLYVHIADVANYVVEGSPIDKEAYDRGTSVYLADRVLPMLPEVLSNNLCSLNPHTDKLTLTCEMTLTKDGALKKGIVYESIIRSDNRLSYKEVDEIVDGNKDLKGKNVFEFLEVAEELRSKIEKTKLISGVLNFDFPETKIIFTDEKKLDIKEIIEYPRYKSNKLIEEFMIMANDAVSRQFSKFPFLYRIHDEPNEEDLSELQRKLDIFGIQFRLEKGTTKEIADLLTHLEKSEHKKVLEKLILRTLSKAVYSSENRGHFGLGLSFYSHFTSPIRRYPDLQIHRIIKEFVRGKLDKKKISHYQGILEDVAEHTSNKERSAEKLEYKVRDYFIVRFYKDKVGQEFEAVVSGIIKTGFFVELPDTAEGFIELGKEFIFDADRMMIFSKITNTQFSFGDKLSVRLKEADEKNIRLNFELLA